MLSWRNLIAAETKTLPWTGGRTLLDSDHARWKISGRLPEEYGWYKFSFEGRAATLVGPADAEPEKLIHKTCGYLVGDRFVSDAQKGYLTNPANVVAVCPQVYLIEEGLERFSRVSVGQFSDYGPYIFAGQEMPLGPEEEVLTAFLDQKDSVDAVAGVSPALEAVFRMESWQRVEAERRRLEEARRRQEEEERILREDARRQLVEKLGDGAGRRAMARQDFNEAARAALAVGGAEFLDAKRSHQRGEMVVKFRLDGRRFECTCSSESLAIIDSGICLTAEYDSDDFDRGTKGDTWFTLESFPSVLREAIREGKLVVYRHVN